jgi:hypothetical protein
VNRFSAEVLRAQEQGAKRGRKKLLADMGIVDESGLENLKKMLPHLRTKAGGILQPWQYERKQERDEAGRDKSNQKSKKIRGLQVKLNNATASQWSSTYDSRMAKSQNVELVRQNLAQGELITKLREQCGQKTVQLAQLAVVCCGLYSCCLLWSVLFAICCGLCSRCLQS